MDVRMNRCMAGGWMYGADSEVEHGGRASDRMRGRMDMWIDGSSNGAEAVTERAANERMDGWMYG